jgi:hypothetical protein
VTIDPWANPNNPRLSDDGLGFGTTASAMIENVNGTRLLVSESNGFEPRVFQIVGYIAVPGAAFPQLGGERNVAMARDGDVYQARQETDLDRPARPGLAVA